MEHTQDGLAEDIKSICLQKIEKAELAEWFEHKLANVGSESFFLTFGLLGRKIPHISVHIDSNLGKPFSGWQLDELSRLCLLLHLPTEGNVALITRLAAASDMREQIVIYRSLAYLENAAEFALLAIDGIRTNMTDVFDAIALDNPYPQTYFPEEAWNQMVLKAIFMERPIHKIIGLDERKNQRLADILFDYVHERWSANREVIPELWRLMPGFINQSIFADLQNVVETGSELAQQAALKALAEAKYEPAKTWLRNQQIATAPISWNEIGEQIRKHI